MASIILREARHRKKRGFNTEEGEINIRYSENVDSFVPSFHSPPVFLNDVMLIS